MTCPICGETASWRIPYRRISRQSGRQSETEAIAGYGWRLCRRCGNGYPSAQPDLHVLRQVWEANRAVEGADPAKTASVWQYRRDFSRTNARRSYQVFAPLATREKPGCFLDVACGLGETVRYFADRGWDAEGIDADPTTLVLHQEIGIRSRIGQFETMDIARSYDLIHIAHAIYFITNPMLFLHRVAEILKPSGVFCIVLANFMAAYDPGLPSYEHTFYPTAGSMRYALALAGFQTVLTRFWGGSIYLAARPAKTPLPPVHPTLIRLGYLTKPARYAFLGRPYLALRRAAKFVLRRG